MKGRQEGPQITIVATEAITKNRFVTVDGKHTAAAHQAGVSLFDTDSGEPIPTFAGAVAAVEAGAAISAGAEVEADSSGRAVTQSSGKVCGVAWGAASAAGDIISVSLK